MRLKQLQRGSLLVLAFGLAACGSSGGGSAITTTTVQGKVTEGPVAGATIFADRMNSGTLYVKDSTELSAVTDAATGNFTLGVPSNYGAYVLVSQGGTDLITGKPAIQMLAPAGSANVTPLTTLVALAPPDQQAALKSKIEATGIKFDDDISTHATDAALFLSKSIETAIETLGASIANTGTTLSADQLSDVQQKAMSAIAASFAAEPSLLTAANLTDGISKGITNTIPNLGTEGVVVNSPAALATLAGAVSKSVGDVATAMGHSDGVFDASAPVVEATRLTGLQSTIDNSAGVNAVTAATVMTVHPLLVQTSFHITGVKIDSTVGIRFTKAMDPTTITTSTFVISKGTSKVVGAVSYDPATKTATFTPTANFGYDTTYTITVSTDIKDTDGNALVIPAGTLLSLTFTTVPQATTGTTGATGTSGTGANF